MYDDLDNDQTRQICKILSLYLNREVTSHRYQLRAGDEELTFEFSMQNYTAAKSQEEFLNRFALNEGLLDSIAYCDNFTKQPTVFIKGSAFADGALLHKILEVQLGEIFDTEDVYVETPPVGPSLFIIDTVSDDEVARIDQFLTDAAEYANTNLMVDRPVTVDGIKPLGCIKIPSYLLLEQPALLEAMIKLGGCSLATPSPVPDIDGKSAVASVLEMLNLPDTGPAPLETKRQPLADIGLMNDLRACFGDAYKITFDMGLESYQIQVDSNLAPKDKAATANKLTTVLRELAQQSGMNHRAACDLVGQNRFNVYLNAKMLHNNREFMDVMRNNEELLACAPQVEPEQNPVDFVRKVRMAAEQRQPYGSSR